MVKDIAVGGRDLEFDFQLGQIRNGCPRLARIAATFLCSPTAEMLGPTTRYTYAFGIS